MKINNTAVGMLLAWLQTALPRTGYRGGTPSRRNARNKDDLPSGYPGAKLARKALAGKCTIRG
jgi:hypothetical protein